MLPPPPQKNRKKLHEYSVNIVNFFQTLAVKYVHLMHTAIWIMFELDEYVVGGCVCFNLSLILLAYQLATHIKCCG